MWNANEEIKRIVSFLENYKNNTNCKGVVLGLSGGKDSTVVAMLSKKVWGNNVYAVMMPNGTQADIQDSKDIAKTLNLSSGVVNIGEAYEGILQAITSINISDKAKTNIPPRLRMTTLYAIAQSLGYRVIGTGNASEGYVGWCTKYGDTGYDFNPIAHLTKTKVVEIGKVLAEEYGLDKRFITKTPSDGLTGKSDEENLGFSYELLDAYIEGVADVERHKQEIEKISQMHAVTQHKREMPYQVNQEKR